MARKIDKDGATGAPDQSPVVINTGDIVVHALIKMGQPLTVKNYLQLSTMGDASCLDDLEGENRAEVEELIEEGLLT